MFGSHLSIAGGLQNALTEAQSLSLDCVQIFTKNQRQWSAPPLKQQQIDEWFAHRKSTGIDLAVSHDSYLINLATPNPENRTKSIDLFTDEIERCEALDIPLLVAHPGAHLGEGETPGLKRIAKALDEIHKRTPNYKTITCLENTAGQGTNLGNDLNHLRTIIDLVKQPERLATCIDTAHALEAGYDLTSAKGARNFLQQLEQIITTPLVRCWHFNDSKTPLGSRVDRHEHIGQGHVHPDAFKTILKHPAAKQTPKILETPKATAPDGRPWDTVNIETLQNLTRRSTTKKTKPSTNKPAKPRK